MRRLNGHLSSIARSFGEGRQDRRGWRNRATRFKAIRTFRFLTASRSTASDSGAACRLDKLGKKARSSARLTYHHHMGTGVQTNGEIDRLMEETGADLVGLLYDTGHLVFSGEDRWSPLGKWFDRIWHVHL